MENKKIKTTPKEIPLIEKKHRPIGVGDVVFKFFSFYF